MKSSAITFSPTFTRHGNSPSTNAVIASAPEKCLNVRPSNQTAGRPPTALRAGIGSSGVTKFQWP